MFWEALQPPRRLTVWEWADAYRVLSTAESSMPGRWETANAEWLREIMDCLSPDNPARIVVLMKGSQVGGTEAGNNLVGHTIHERPGPIMVVQPTVEMGKRWSQQRLKPLTKLPVIAAKMSANKSRDAANTMAMKDFDGGVLVIAGANSAASLASMPVRTLILDEVDRYPYDVDGEGDPVGLALARTTTFLRSRKVFMISTPTITGESRIETAFEDTDQRRYHLPCPYCGHMQWLHWGSDKDTKGGIRWEKHDPSVVWYECEECGAAISEDHKGAMLAAGEWRATAQATEPGSVGFHLSTLYSPYFSWRQMVHEWNKAQRDPALLQAFINTRLGETWDPVAADGIDADTIAARASGLIEAIPDVARLITAGVDVQDDRLEAELVAWGPGYESWSLDYVILYGDPTARPVWNSLDAWLKHVRRRQSGTDAHVDAVAIDSGHATSHVYEYCKRHKRSRCTRWAIKGRGGPAIPIWSSKASRSNKQRVPVHTIGVDDAKWTIYQRLAIDEAGPGFCHVPEDRDPEWYEQLTAEQRVRIEKATGPHYKWQLRKGRKRNEALDCRVYALAALEGLIAGGRRLDPARPRPTQPKKRKGWIGRKRGKWLK